jgi:hypothetical protein
MHIVIFYRKHLQFAIMVSDVGNTCWVLHRYCSTGFLILILIAIHFKTESLNSSDYSR